MVENDYKYRIDKEALKKFFTMDEPPKESYRAVHIVVMTVIMKHFAKYVNLRKELESQCIVALLERKPRYDLSYSAYNYAYTICRNEIGNFLNKQRELIVEDILPLTNASEVPATVSLPSEINKFKKYLTGEQEFDILEITAKDAINLALFVEQNQPTRGIRPPDFIMSSPNVIPILYKILIKL